jgi:DNA-binding NarL/FixJ family response regulator
MIKVGIVEDDKTLRQGFETLINQSPDIQCVCTCDTVAEALRKIPKCQPDVVLMDIQLPDKSGIECAARVKELLPQVQIVVVTVYEDSDRIFQALQAGACGYLLMRSPSERIIAAIREAHGGGVPMTPEIARKVIGQFRAKATVSAQLEGLTAREKEVLELVMQGLDNQEIADRMGVSLATVRFHLQHIYDKLHIHSRNEMIFKFK